jgi:hypothetical protein
MSGALQVGTNVVLTVTGKGGQCALCDNIVNFLLHFDDGSPAAIQCSSICLWRFKRCISTCERVIKALGESSHYPCVAAGMCPEFDEFGDLNTCSYSWRKHACEPEGKCHMHVGFPRPRCELKPGYLEYERYNKLIRKNTGMHAFCQLLHSQSAYDYADCKCYHWQGIGSVAHE